MQDPLPELGTLDEIRRLAGGDGLRLTFVSGARAVLSAPELWLECRSADGVLRRLAEIPAPAGVTIAGLHPVGEYAVNIAFSDGEVRGIYPFSLLIQLAARQIAGTRAAA